MPLFIPFTAPGEVDYIPPTCMDKGELDLGLLHCSNSDGRQPLAKHGAGTKGKFAHTKRTKQYLVVCRLTL